MAWCKCDPPPPPPHLPQSPRPIHPLVQAAGGGEEEEEAMASSQANLDKMQLRQSYRNLWHSDLTSTIQADFPCMSTFLFPPSLRMLILRLPMARFRSDGFSLSLLLLLMQIAASRSGGKRSSSISPAPFFFTPT